jgi:hypothetical protein
MCLKAYGPILGSSVENVWLTYERIRLIFGLFFLFKIYFENVLLLVTTLWGSTKLVMLTLKLIKNGEANVLATTMSLIYNILSMLTKFDRQR